MYVSLTFWVFCRFVKNDSKFVSEQKVSLPRTRSLEDIIPGQLKKPAQIQVETMAIVRVLLEISLSGKTTATNRSIAIHTKL